ncbi:restriction endonuclease [Thalassotalea sp. 1_MG-2023]|uniref:restriction endonuclease n=1 Tax=Thalassotalea sp. 1_MG-2023 TaxID=3062680 RepID=UPI0026E3D109|nr:restriction endonuclease [Thalassotalea sp. 1_MG-2023]MDO6427135.1 restriction endonuclease [Thalassotalea sp. 1_MG-2023]
MTSGFLHKLFDWKNFELFVKDLYSTDGNLLVEHDVTEIGKSGASRQIDVKVTQRTGFHTYVTLIECKFWKKAVERTTVDIVAASIDDLNASKGVIFTTKGYQQGAETYAKSKNIDIFVVRDLREEEWGAPGRNLQLYLNIVGGQMSKTHFPNAQAKLIVQEQPDNMNLNIELSKDSIDDESLLLYSIVNGDTGNNLTRILAEVHSVVIKNINAAVGQNNELLNQKLTVTSDVRLDLTGFEFRQLRNKYAAIDLSEMTLSFVTQISRSELNIDRGEKLDYALVVQNYVNEQAHYVSKKNGDLVISAYDNETSDVTTSNDTFINGSTANIFLSPWVGVDIQSSTRVAKSSLLNLKIKKADNTLGFCIFPVESR